MPGLPLSPPPGQISVLTSGAGSHKKRTFFPAPRLVERARPLARPGHTSLSSVTIAPLLPFSRAGTANAAGALLRPEKPSMLAANIMGGHPPKLRLLLCCLALLFLAAPAMAEEDELAPGFDRCMEQSGGVTTEMLNCLQQAYEYWDARLNTNYKKARQACKSSSDPKACSDKLLKGQRAWVQYKEVFTDLVQLPNEGGSMARLNSMSFLTGETRKQALLLGQIAGE